MAKNKNETETHEPKPQRQYEVLAPVTLPTLKIADGQTAHIRVVRKIVEKPKLLPDGSPALRPDGSPASTDVMQVQNLDDDKLYALVASTVLKKELTGNYPNDSYVGKCFRVTKNAKAEGKTYKTWEILEIRDPDHV